MNWSLKSKPNRHDELVFEVKTEQVNTLKAHITTIMQNAVELSVPLLVDSGAGNNWDSGAGDNWEEAH